MVTARPATTGPLATTVRRKNAVIDTEAQLVDAIRNFSAPGARARLTAAALAHVDAQCKLMEADTGAQVDVDDRFADLALPPFKPFDATTQDSRDARKQARIEWAGMSAVQRAEWESEEAFLDKRQHQILCAWCDARASGRSA